MADEEAPKIIEVGSPAPPPADGGRYFVWCSEREALACSMTVEHAHIVIRNPGESRKVPPCGRTVLTMAFMDLGDNAPEQFKSQLFTPEQAKHIVSFVESNEVPIVVNCSAGVCRSPGVVLALRRHYGGDQEEVFRLALPNIFVTSILTRALKGIEG